MILILLVNTYISVGILFMILILLVNTYIMV
jgi:hypothetical protein